MKIVVNRCYGGFGLSEEAFKFLGLKWEGYEYADIERTDPKLVECVETLGDKANGSYAKLEVIEIPDGTEYEIDDYDGIETIHEVHQSW